MDNDLYKKCMAQPLTRTLIASGVQLNCRWKKGWGTDNQSNDIPPKDMWYDYQSMCIETYHQVSDIRRTLEGN